MIKVSAAIILDGRRVLLAQRPSNKHQGGKWEFPGGKVEENESAEEAVIRECKEEIGITLVDPAFYESIEFNYPDKHVCLQFFKVELFKGQPQGLEGQKVAWFNLDELNQLSFPDANAKIVSSLTKLSF